MDNNVDAPGVTETQEMPFNRPHRIPCAELRRVLQDAQSILRDNLGSTRSHSEASTNQTNPHNYNTRYSAHHNEDAPELAD